MPDRHYGSKYVKGLSTKDIAARMRAEIKLAVERGELPGKPVSYSVRSRDYNSIDIAVRGLLGSRDTDENANRREGKRWPWLTDEARRIMGILDTLHNAYNYDGSDIMTDYFDVNYYGGVTIETEESARWRVEEAARKAARPPRPICPDCNKPIRTRTEMGHIIKCEPAMARIRANAEAKRKAAAS